MTSDVRPPTPGLTIVAALDRNGVIGRGGELPWHLPDDLKRFKRMTMGHCLIMGRRTYDSIGRVLPGRVSIVITRHPQEVAPADRLLVASDLDTALDLVATTDMDHREAFVVGGGQIYELALPRAEQLYLTRVQTSVEGDVYFPEIDYDDWRVMMQDIHPADEKHEFEFVTQRWERR